MTTGGLVLLILCAAGLGILGIYALHTAPLLSVDAGFTFILSASDLRRLGDISLEPTFVHRLPEFFTPAPEANWWQIQEGVYTVLKGRKSVDVEVTGPDGLSRGLHARVDVMPLAEIIQRTGLIYFVALIYMVSAIALHWRHRSAPGPLLTGFLMAGALYLITSAPMASRALTLHPLSFKLLTAFLYAAAGGMITLLHFALVFPEPKAMLRKCPWLPSLFYVYYVLTVALYFLGFTAFGTTFPFFCVLTAVMVVALGHSLLTEADPFLRKQIWLALLAPVFVSLFLIGSQLLPVILGKPPWPYVYFALLSLVLPFALPMALDNVRLYQQQLALQQASQREKERLRQELHDMILNDLSCIQMVAQGSLTLLDQDPTGIRKHPQGIQDIAAETSEQVPII